MKLKKGYVFEQNRSREELLRLEEQVLQQIADAKCEKAAMQAGLNIRNGDRSVEQIIEIANWKSARRRELIKDNEPALVSEVLGMALAARNGQAAVGVMTCLNGVGVPMASAILACVLPERHTVIDVRALDALGLKGRVPTPSLYGKYLNFCLAEAKRLGLSLRQLDRALWKAGTP